MEIIEAKIEDLAPQKDLEEEKPKMERRKRPQLKRSMAVNLDEDDHEIDLEAILKKD